MQTISRSQAILYHLYPGIGIAIVFIALAPLAKTYGLPPQLGALAAILLAAVPLLLLHLRQTAKKEKLTSVADVNGFRQRLPIKKLALYVAGLVIFSFLIWGAMEPVNRLITDHWLKGLPDWFTVQDFKGYSKTAITLTLVINLFANGILAPIIEEYYFRGYLLARMNNWGSRAFIVNGILFSLYHLWQPQVWLTLIFAMVPLAWATWKTKDLRVAIYTHCLLNLIGAILAFAQVNAS